MNTNNHNNTEYEHTEDKNKQMNTRHENAESGQEPQLITEYDIYLFREGKHFTLHEKLGAHVISHNNVTGTYFAVWAPNATSVSVIGNFNHWQKNANHLKAREDGSGIWQGFVPRSEEHTSELQSRPHLVCR